MEQQKKQQEEKLKRIKSKKKHLLHYLLIYLICLLAACITWFLVRYSMREERVNYCSAEMACTSPVSEAALYGEGALYV